MAGISKGELEVERRYEQAKPRQFGTLHERMHYLLEAARRCRLWEYDNTTWQAIHDLETEVRHHQPAVPPFGRRTITYR